MKSTSLNFSLNFSNFSQALRACRPLAVYSPQETTLNLFAIFETPQISLASRLSPPVSSTFRTKAAQKGTATALGFHSTRLMFPRVFDIALS